MKQIRNRINSEKGSVLLWTMMFIALFFLTVSTVAVITILEIRQSTKIDSSTEAYLLAEAGVERAKNYANSGQETGGSETGIIDGDEYTFWVVKAVKSGTTAIYDNPPRPCNNISSDVDTFNYCYYSQADVGSIRRKIDGERKEVPTNQGKSFLQGLPVATLDEYNMLDITPVSGAITSPQKFYLKWEVENINDIPDESLCTSSRSNLCFSFGLFESGVGSLDANIKKSGTNTAVYLTGNTPATQSYTQTVEIPSSSTTAYFEMTYYVGGTTILKVSDSNKECLGVLVRNDLYRQWNDSILQNTYKMFFNRDSAGSTTVLSNGFGINLLSQGKTVTIKNIFFRVE